MEKMDFNNGNKKYFIAQNGFEWVFPKIAEISTKLI